MANPILYNKTRPVADLELDDSGHAIDINNDRHKKNAAFLPICLEGDLTPTKFNDWLDRRCMPERREGLMEAREEFFGFDHSPKNRNRFSLTDQYWIRFHPKEHWEDMNFFTNPYDQGPGRIFFEPWTVTKEEAMLRNPDVTTNGNLRKRWQQDPDTLVSYLLKAGNDDKDKDEALLQRPLCEVLASMMLEKLSYRNFVTYTLEIYGLRLCSKCRNFITKDTEFVPMAHIYYKNERTEKDRDTINYLTGICRSYGIDIRYDLREMIAADYMIGNYDRHLGNFGLLRDVNTGKMISFAPLFDFGSAYWWPQEYGMKTKAYKFFQGKHHDAVRKFIAKKGDSLGNIDTSDMLALVDLYPYLPHARKDVIKENIRASVRHIKSIEQAMLIEREKK